MKSERIKSVTFSNRRRQMVFVYRSGKAVHIHYGTLGIRNIQDVWIDKETGGRSVGIKLGNGRVDFMPYDQPLAIVNDAEYLLQNHMELLIAQIKEMLQKRHISKKYLAERLETSESQVNRLLNPRMLNKNLKQLYEVTALLGLDLHLSAKKAA